MSKLKTKSSVKKRFKVSGSGKVIRSYAFKRHNLRKRSSKMLRQARGTTVMAACDAKILAPMMPYGLK